LKTGDLRLAEARAGTILPKIERQMRESANQPVDVRVSGDGTDVDFHVTMLFEQDHRGERTLTTLERQNLTTLLHRDEQENNPVLSALFVRYYEWRQLPGKSKLEWEAATDRGLGRCSGQSRQQGHHTTIHRGPYPAISRLRREPSNCALSSVFAFAVRQGYLEVNPVAGPWYTTVHTWPHT